MASDVYHACRLWLGLWDNNNLSLLNKKKKKKKKKRKCEGNCG